MKRNQFVTKTTKSSQTAAKKLLYVRTNSLDDIYWYFNRSLYYNEIEIFLSMGKQLKKTLFAVLWDTSQNDDVFLKTRLLRVILSRAILCEHVVDGFYCYFKKDGKLAETTCLVITKIWMELSLNSCLARSLFNLIIQFGG